MEEKQDVSLEVWEHPIARVLAPLRDDEVREKTDAPWIDDIEKVACRRPQVDCPLEHVFTPGLRLGEWVYTRTITMRRGLLITSKIHRTEHQFFVTKGRCLVWSPNGEVQIIEAGHRGITEAGTRRLLLIEEDTVWTTIHPTNTQDLSLIEEQVIVPHDFNAGLRLSDEEMIALADDKSGTLREALNKFLTH